MWWVWELSWKYTQYHNVSDLLNSARAGGTLIVWLLLVWIGKDAHFLDKYKDFLQMLKLRTMLVWQIDILSIYKRVLEIVEHEMSVDENIFQIILAGSMGRFSSYKCMVSRSAHCKLSLYFTSFSFYWGKFHQAEN